MYQEVGCSTGRNYLGKYKRVYIFKGLWKEQGGERPATPTKANLVKRKAGVAQWQSKSFVNFRLEVQFLSPAPTQYLT